MAQDIFNRVVDLGVPLAADATRLILPDIGDEDMMVQNVGIQYQQNVTRLWEVGSAKTYFIAGRTQGTMTIKRVVGGKGIGSNFIKTYADVCNVQHNHLTLSMNAGCTGAEDKGSLSVEGIVITSIAYSIAAADMLINEDLSLMFAKLTI